MFSTTDDGSRPLRVRVTDAARERDVAVPPGLYAVARRAAFLPTEGRLDDLAREIARHERAEGRPVSRVQIEVWRPVYDPRTLAPRLELLTERTLQVGAAPRGDF